MTDDLPAKLRLLPPADGRASGGDAALWQSVCAGDESAMREVWRRHVGVVRRVLERGLGPDVALADVDDLVQEAFFRLFARPTALRDVGAVRAYLLQVAANVLRAELRSRRVRRWVRLFAPDELPEVAHEGANLEAREVVRRFSRVLDRLAPSERVAFVLRFIEELDMQEVADATGVSLSTLKRRLPRIVKRVNRLIGEDPALARFRSSLTPWSLHAP